MNLDSNSISPARKLRPQSGQGTDQGTACTYHLHFSYLRDRRRLNTHYPLVLGNTDPFPQGTQCPVVPIGSVSLTAGVIAPSGAQVPEIVPSPE